MVDRVALSAKLNMIHWGTVIPVLGSWRQEDQNFKVTLSYIASLGVFRQPGLHKTLVSDNKQSRMTNVVTVQGFFS